MFTKLFVFLFICLGIYLGSNIPNYINDSQTECLLLGNCNPPQNNEFNPCEHMGRLNDDRFHIIQSALKTLDLEVINNGEQIKSIGSNNLSEAEQKRLNIQRAQLLKYFDQW